MISLKKLNDFLVSHTTILGVPANELEDFLFKYKLTVRKDYRDFIQQYGNSKIFLEGLFLDASFDKIKEYYQNEQLFHSDLLPNDGIFLGINFTDELICICNSTGKIYSFYAQELDGFLYGNIDSFLFFCLFNSLNFNLLCDNIQTNLNIKNVTTFANDFAKYKIADLDIFSHDFYLNDNALIHLNYKSKIYNRFAGGIFNHLSTHKDTY